MLSLARAIKTNMHLHATNTTAILVFVRDEQEEADVKALRSYFGAKGSMKMVHTLNNHVLRVSRQSGLPVFVVKGAQQVGETFGERFANAFETVFAVGYSQVIAVGNDCLHLTKEYLLRAATLLQNDVDMVLGPTQDGGAYIVGLSLQAYQRGAFIQRSWQTSCTLKSLIDYARQNDAYCHFLPLSDDFDDARALQKIALGRSFKSRIVCLLRDIILSNRLQPQIEVFLILSKYSFVATLRAPPAISF